MDIRQNILATLAYYDVFDFPLKAIEVQAKMVKFNHFGNYQLPTQHQSEARRWTSPAPKRSFGCGVSNFQFTDIQKELDQLILDGIVGMRNNYYFLGSREHIVPLRIKRGKIAKRKWQITKRAVWWLRFVPYVRAVFASGSLAMRNTDELSDLDVLVVVKYGRIWLARFLISGVLTLLGKRRKAEDKIAPDKICLNHYITDRSLHIPYQSVYTAQTYANLMPIYVQDAHVVENFKKANSWVLDYVAQWNFQGSALKKHTVGGKSSCRSFANKVGKAAELFLEKSDLGNILEKWARRYQLRKIAINPWSADRGGHVVANDDQLAFHPDSIENKILEEFEARLTMLNITLRERAFA